MRSHLGPISKSSIGFIVILTTGNSPILITDEVLNFNLASHTEVEGHFVVVVRIADFKGVHFSNDYFAFIT